MAGVEDGAAPALDAVEAVRCGRHQKGVRVCWAVEDEEGGGVGRGAMAGVVPNHSKE
jgi:hypothetical protein